MHIRRAERSEYTLNDLTSPNYPTSIVIPSQTSNSSSGNGILNFSIALGGILIVTIVIGIIVYLYRKKINCRQKMNSKSSKGSSGRISCIMDYYSNEFIPKKVISNNKSISNEKNDASQSAITKDVTKDVTKKTKKTENNTKKSLKSHISEFYTRNSNKIINLNLSRSKSEVINRNDAIENHRSKNTKSVKSPFISTSDDKNKKISSEYSVPQISSPISMPSASIYDIDRANTLANSLSRSTAFQVQAPPIPPLLVHPSSIYNKQPKEVERNSPSKSNSFYNLIPYIFTGSETTTTTTVEVSPNVNNIGVDSQHKITITPQVGVIPDWSKAPWHDDLNFNKDNRNNNNNNNNNNNSNNDDDDDNDDDDNDNDDKDDKDDNDDKDDKDDNDDNDDNDNNDLYARYNIDDNSSEQSSRYSDLIRFSNSSSNASKISIKKNRINQQGSPLNPNSNPEIIITQDNNSESSEPELPDDKTSDKISGDFIKELKSNIEKDPEKFEFLKNPAENHNNWKRNGNFFEYKLQRSKTII